MPFDYPNIQRYEVDFDDLQLHVQNNFRIDFDYYNEWLDGWIRVLKNAEIDTQIQIDSLLENGIYKFEVFQQEVHFGNVTFKLNFIIDGVDEFVKKAKPETLKFKAEDFSKKIKWTREVEPTFKPLSNPIYLVWFPMYNHEYLVIDGNHRVTEQLGKAGNEINGILIDPTTIINKGILLFSVEKAMYTFIVESNFMKEKIIKGEHSHKKLFESSFINHGLKVFNK